MDGNFLGLVELLVGAGIVLFLAFRELRLLKKDREPSNGDDVEKADPPDERPGG